jgi:sugar lactone lactonase YvrE
VLVGNSRGASVAAFDLATGGSRGLFVDVGSGGLQNPDSLTWSPEGDLLVSSGCPTTADVLCDPMIPSQVLRYRGDTGAFVDVFASEADSPLYRPYGKAFGPDGMLYVASFASDTILRFDGSTGAYVDTFATAPAPDMRQPGDLNGPNGVSFGPDGMLYVTTEGSISIDGVITFPGLPSQTLRYDIATGEKTVAVTPAAPEGGQTPSLVGVFFDSEGALITTDFMNEVVTTYDATSLPVAAWSADPEDAIESAYCGYGEAQPDGSVLVALGDLTDDSVGAITIAGPTGRTLVPLGPALQRPMGLTVRPARP